MTRLARLYRRRAEIQAELAEVDAQIADELAGNDEPRPPRRRRSTRGDGSTKVRSLDKAAVLRLAREKGIDLG